MLRQMNAVLTTMLNDDKFIPTLAKIYKKIYDELINAGFTREEAVQIVMNYKLSAGGN